MRPPFVLKEWGLELSIRSMKNAAVPSHYNYSEPLLRNKARSSSEVIYYDLG